MRYNQPRTMLVSTMTWALVLAFLYVTLFVSPVASLGIHTFSAPNPTLFSSTTSLMAKPTPYCDMDRRRLLAAVLAVSTATVSSIPVRAEAVKSNFNYELGNDGECQTSCVLKCQSKLNLKNIKNDEFDNCLDACVRSGDRYCHQETASKSSPSAVEATSSRYIPTTMEPTIKASKPIPGLMYNSNRGGAWRD